MRYKLCNAIGVVCITLLMITTTVQAAPKEIMTFSSIPVWDYHQTNYDKDGNIRVIPSKTTFNLSKNEELNEYLPKMDTVDTEIGKEININCNIDNEKQQAWFDEINKISLKDDSGNPNLEQQLGFNKKGNSINILENQRPISNNKWYTIKIYSTGYDPAYIKVHVVQQEEIKILISYPMNPKVGEDIRFELDNFNYAILNPVSRVILEYNGVEKELVKFEDYHIISNLLTVYSKNVNTNNSNLMEPGRYTIKIYADGFKPASKRFEIAGKTKNETYDVVTKASTGGGTDGSEGLNMQANIIFNHDLLANALILNELSLGTKESKKIVKRWEINTTSWDAAISEDGLDIFDWTDYINAVKESALDGEYLTYEEYVSSGEGKIYKNRPYQVKQVLEDNLLGEAQLFNNILGKETPELKYSSIVEGESLIISCDDKEYLNKITEIKVNDSYNVLDKSLYSISEDKLTIDSKVLKPGKVKLDFYAKGYKSKFITVNVEKKIDEIILELYDVDGYELGEDVTVKGLTNDFITNLESVILNGQTLLTEEQGGSSSNDWYTIKDNSIILQSGLFKESKEYVLEIKAKYYGSKYISFVVQDKDSNENENTETPPTPVRISKDMFISSYKIYFNDSYKWLKKISNVTVNDINYKSGLGWQQDTEHYGAYPSDEYLGIGNRSFKNDKDNVVVVSAEGYKDLTFIITRNGELVNEDIGDGEINPNKIEKVKNLKATETTESNVKLSWDAPESLTGLVEYVVYKDGKKIVTVESSNTEAIISELRSNKIYGFKVTAKYANGLESKPQSINVRTKKE